MEKHRTSRIGWLRAAVLGANDGILSTSSLVLGVAAAHDELGISETLRARPIQAALASAASFAVGAAMPLIVTMTAPQAALSPFVAGTSLIFLALLGGIAARVGGAGILAGALRVTFWGAFAMALLRLVRLTRTCAMGRAIT